MEVQLNPQSSDLHNGVDPAEIYFGEPARADILNIKTQEKLSSLSVYRVSPFGVEIKVSNPELSRLKIGDAIDVNMVFGAQETYFSGLIVGSIQTLSKGALIGVRLFDEPLASDPSVEKRAGKRWAFNDSFLPTGVAPNTLRFNDYIYFKVRDVSSTGFSMETSLRNKFLIKGITLNCRMNFPMIGESTVSVEIRNARRVVSGGKEVLMVGCKLLNPSQSYLRALSDYTVQFSSQPLSENVRDSGLIPATIAKGLTFGFVKNESEYKEVLKLRHLAYTQVGKMDPNSPIESAGDIFDSRARILYAKHKGKMVGSIRLMFHSANDLFEHEQFLSLPSEFPRKEEIVEMTRLCTDPNYRGMDLFYSICARASLAIVQSGRKYMLGSTVDKLLPVYQKIGWMPTGQYYEHKDLGNEKHQLLLCNMEECVSGKHLSYRIWKDVYSEVYSYLSANGQMRLDPVRNTKLFLYDMISRVFGGE
jgi:hypothetical protein